MTALRNRCCILVDLFVTVVTGVQSSSMIQYMGFNASDLTKGYNVAYSS